MNLSTKRHSLSHIMAQAVKQNFPKSKIATGPDTDDWFYYDFDFLEAEITEKDLKKIEKSMKKIISQGQDFKKFEVSYEEAREILDKMWEWFKKELVNKLESWDFKNKEKINWKISFYINISKWKSNDYYSEIQDFLKEKWYFDFSLLDWDQIKNLKFIDMCTGPHVESTKELDANSFKLSKIAGAYWLGNADNKQLTRLYAYAFENKNKLDEHLKMLEEAKKRDHRILWAKLKLFTISELVGPWLPMFQPAWAILRKELEDYLWELHSKKWYQRVWTPHLAKETLYETSGHAGHYLEDMFKVHGGSSKEDFFLKPMNCPHHMQIFDDNQFSYKDMPIRYFEAATVYRDEKSGQLSGLSRVRSITQDDWHLFCRVNQIEEEVKTVTDIIKEFYTTMWMTKDYWVSLSIRGENKEKYLWGEEVWKKAEWALKNVCENNNLPYKEIPWEAAFYWPKLDFMFKDAIGREWQLATIQCDFNLPERFKLSFKNENNQEERPVVIHRAILWSFERWIAMLIENFAWVFPLWLSPRQVKIIPVMPKFDKYAKKVEEKLIESWIRVSWDYSTDWLNKKIRMAEKMHNNYILVIWEEEQNSTTVAVRNYKTKEQTIEKLDEFINRILKEIKEKTL